nr:unnamed protein product [Digitaria exilis]
MVQACALYNNWWPMLAGECYFVSLLSHDLMTHEKVIIVLLLTWLHSYTSAALMYVLVPMPCLFFGGGSTHFLTSREGGGWINAAKFLTGASAMGSLAIPAILRHAGLIETGAMFIEFTSFFILVCTVLCFHRATLDEDW